MYYIDDMLFKTIKFNKYLYLINIYKTNAEKKFYFIFFL